MTSATLETAGKPTVLIVDDVPDNIASLSAILKDNYQLKTAPSGETALHLAASSPGPDLILLNVMMSGKEGYETCRRLKSSVVTADIPVILVASADSNEHAEKGLKLGAADYLHTPFNSAIVLARLGTQLQLKQARQLLADHHDKLEALVEQRTAQLVRMQDATILAMASLAETRDNETGNHLRRTQNYVAALARHLQSHPRFTAVLTEENIDLLFKSAPLHDIGKVGVPDHILLKPGKLNEQEFEEMKLHPVYGRNTIASVEAYLGGSNDFLRFAREIAYSHQEKWDGTGYPEGLQGDAIPVSARLMAIADVYDALISKRVYKPAFSHQHALTIMRDGRGTHFDPDMLDGFIAIEKQFEDIALRFHDTDMLFAEVKSTE